MCGCAIGTIKSRVNRARNRLTELLEMNGAAEEDYDEARTLAVLNNQKP
jgi:RNA polymerase sigma-70 factor (ECF subfamily)